MTDRRFKFRAEVVLELRRRRDEEAQRARVAADLAFQVAERALDEARRALQSGCEQPRDPDADAAWYRNWMVGLRTAVARRSGELDERRRVRDEALARALSARRDLRAIERLRSRRKRAFDQETVRREQRQIDQLATRQHAARRRAAGGTS